MDQARTPTDGTGPDEVLFITRERQSDGTLKHDYYLSNANASTPLSEFARVAKAEHRIEECFHRGKSDVGLGDYQVRNWIGWHHHQTLSLIAASFLNEETRRGKKQTPAMTVPQARRLIAAQIEHQLQSHMPSHTAATAQRWLQRNELASASRYESRNLLPPLKNQLRT